VRQLALDFKLPTARKKDSQGICFIGRVDIDDFLADFLKLKNGSVLDKNGKVIGEHKGAAIYTIGQRHGFEIYKSTNNPYYCIDKDIKNNTITVSQNLNENSHKIFILKDENWITMKPEDNKKYIAQVRHLGEKILCQLSYKNKNYQVKVFEPLSVSTGQSLVVYDKNICLGGGIISSFC
ncbi:MAG TPA: tRNA 2-thiouridine(34) synthase MnmA, partial [Candidatus Vogelbacteria bacterium]|nr:tRNA 2-thiouridine(34) synthase MnmA [Candidatus Vogelbacteria bacterium]